MYFGNKSRPELSNSKQIKIDDVSRFNKEKK